MTRMCYYFVNHFTLLNTSYVHSHNKIRIFLYMQVLRMNQIQTMKAMQY